MKKAKIIICTIFFVIVIFIGFIWVYGPNFNIYILPPSAQKYGEIALDIIDKNGLYSNSKDWKEIKDFIKQDISKSKTYDDVLEILNDKIKIAGGKHSFITTKTELLSEDKNQVMPSYEIKENILILNIPSFAGQKDEANQYVNILIEAIKNEVFDGIILDMSLNGGGNMEPMILGLSQLIPDGELFYFVDNKGSSTPIILENGYINAGSYNLNIDIDKPKLKIPIAIITSENTGSSGEMTLLCFRGLENVKTFGQSTAGYATINKSFVLYDGSYIQITCGNVKTRTNENFGEDPIKPDIVTERPYEDSITWIKEVLKSNI